MLSSASLLEVTEPRDEVLGGQMASRAFSPLRPPASRVLLEPWRVLASACVSRRWELFWGFGFHHHDSQFFVNRSLFPTDFPIEFTDLGGSPNNGDLHVQWLGFHPCPRAWSTPGAGLRACCVLAHIVLTPCL